MIKSSLDNALIQKAFNDGLAAGEAAENDCLLKGELRMHWYRGYRRGSARRRLKLEAARLEQIRKNREANYAE